MNNKIIENYLKCHNMTLKQLADACELSLRTMQKIADCNPKVRLTSIFAVIDVLGITFEEFDTPFGVSLGSQSRRRLPK